jgi:hypothetical protein
MGTADGESGTDVALVMSARSRLEAGCAPAEVYAELATDTQDGLAAAWAVCLALGIPAIDVRHRLGHGVAELPSRFHPGEEALCGEAFEAVGMFDVPRPPSERGTEAERLLNVALGALGGLRSGHALSLSRRFVRGELTGVFLSLARTAPRRGRGRPAEYWTALSQAGELLLGPAGAEHQEVEQALRECRQRAARVRRHGPGDGGGPAGGPA